MTGAAIALCQDVAHATTVATPAASAASSASPPAGSDGGILYRAERAGATVFVYGTVHVGKASFYPLSPPVLRALRRAQVLLVEVDLLAPDLPQQFRRHGLLPETAPALQIATVDAERIDPMLRAAQIDPTFARRFKPDVLAATLGALSARELGLSTGYSVESFLLGFARAIGIAVVELEGLAAQLSMNDGLSELDRLAILTDALRALADGSALRTVARIVQAWQQHDLDLLAAPQTPSSAPASATAVGSRFLHQTSERNAAITERILAQTSSYQRLFAAVGVLHLPGATGVPGRLEQHGFRLTRLL